MSTCTTKLLVVAAAAASGAVFAQPELAATDTQIQPVERIAELRAEGGPTAAGLMDPLRALALLYQEAGDHALAVVALEEARYVTRIHNGLAAADEALLLRQQIRSEKALGDNERVWDLEQDMVAIARQHHDDVRILPIFRELADDRLGVIEKVRAGERPPIIFIGCYYSAQRPRYDDPRGERLPPADPHTGGVSAGGGPSCIGGTPGGIVTRLRHEVLMYYADAIEIILRTGDYASQEIRQLEKAALRVAGGRGGGVQSGEPGGSFTYCSGGTLDGYLALEILDSCLAPVGRADKMVVANVGNRAGLIRLLSYEMRSAAPAAARANAVAELADWHVLAVPADRRRFERYAELALALYERAYRELQQSDDLQTPTQMFAPELPVTLPTYERNPFASVATESPRYIDVAFAVTKYGTSERIEILDTSKDATRSEERDLIRLVESTSFRPRVVDGELADAAPVVLRYHLGP
jgi:hypothetical protein